MQEICSTDTFEHISIKMWEILINKSIITEKSVAKGDIAHNEQFLLLPECFQNLSAAEASERVRVWESVNMRMSLQSNHYWTPEKLEV